MIRLPPMLGIALILPILFSACDDDWQEDICPCHHGGSIGGWEDSDTTDVFNRDSAGGFDIIVKDWENSNTQDINL